MKCGFIAKCGDVPVTMDFPSAGAVHSCLLWPYHSYVIAIAPGLIRIWGYS
jgi:hypothetical protein